MSNAKTPIKVLRTGLKRVDKAWTQGQWAQKGDDGKYYVCLEGALFGYCDAKKGLTAAQDQARAAVLEVIKDRYEGRFNSIPSFNDDPHRTKEEVMEVIKLAIVRLETGEAGGPDVMSDEEIDDLLEFMRKTEKK